MVFIINRRKKDYNTQITEFTVGTYNILYCNLTEAKRETIDK
jgi:hypothetical protein